MSSLRECAHEIGAVVRAGRHEGFSGQRSSQYLLDVVADEVALRVLHGAGFRVVSEESGVSGSGEYTVVLDPIDGSTNCDHGVPFFATSLAVLREGTRCRARDESGDGDCLRGRSWPAELNGTASPSRGAVNVTLPSRS